MTGRIARALLELCDQPEAVREKEGVGVRLNRQELSRIVGCSREMVSGVLRSLEKQSRIRTSGRRVLVIGHGTGRAENGPLNELGD